MYVNFTENRFSGLKDLIETYKIGRENIDLSGLLQLDDTHYNT